MIETNKDIVRNFLNALCTGDLATLKPLMTDDIEAVAMGTSAISGSRRHADIENVVSLFPILTQSGLNPRIISMTAEEDRVAVEWEGNAILSNGAQYNNHYFMIFFLRGGKVCKFREYFCTKLAEEVLAPLLAGGG
jgi:ketosteroid isomerase-like protein